MRRTRRLRAKPLNFSNERFLELLAQAAGVLPVGILGRETPLDLSGLEAARASLLVGELFSKYDDGKPSPEKTDTTWKRFHAAEESCRATNEVFYARSSKDPFWVCVRRRVWDILKGFSWDECAKHFAFGPGSTTRLARSECAAAYKYSGIPESTSGNAVLAACAISMLPLWKHNVRVRAEELGIDGLTTIVPGNSVLAVPKNYKTDRTIAKEPCMNIYVQKGIGRVIRHRLYQVGVNLDDQTRNQRAAYQGSLDGSLATIDLSMASDTIAREVVSYLLPNDWYYALEQCRSPVGVLPSGEKISYQKFSSMGNGYTFELESLIFYAICQQCSNPNVNEWDDAVCAYGDDLIVRSEHYDTVCQRLVEAGFTPNPKKSFSTGPYRESCGKHYFLGNDITPFYIRRPVDTLDRLFLTHNNVWRWSERTGVPLQEFCVQLRSLAPSKWRTPRLPDGYGDGAFIGYLSDLTLDSHPHGWEYWQVKALARTSIELSDLLPDGQSLASLKELEHRRSVLPSGFQIRLGKGVVRAQHLTESRSGLPSREGKYREINILIPRYP